MYSKIQEGLNILSEEGSVSFVRKTLNYLHETVRYSVIDRYTLSTGSTEVAFTAPNQTVFRRNKRRFETERGEITDLLEEIDEDDIFFDIGANTGLYTLFVGKRYPSVDVIAFEPYPPNVRLLRRDIERNNLRNVDVREIALSDSEGTIAFSQPETEDAGYGSSSIESDTSNSDTTVKVPTRSGDELISHDEVPAPNVVKIDVEGAEPLVIDGMENALDQPECRLVYCEIHRSDVEYRPSIGDFGVTLSDMRSRFEELGFEVEKIRTESSEVLLKAYK